MKLNALLIIFLGIYAISGFALLIRLRWNSQTLPRIMLAEICLTYACTIFLIAFEVARSVWDCFHGDHFPLAVSDVVLVGVFIALGHLTFSLYNRLPEVKK